MCKLMFRTLNADEIDVRIAQINEKGASLLLYKDARCDMNILDETVGAMNWQRGHARENANCIVSIWDEKKSQWISKEDTGTESYTEKEKGIASDSFKRACVNWGIGRELYTAPFIYVNSSKMEIKEKNGKYITFDKFTVTEINYDENRQIIGLVIQNQNGVKVYSYGTMINSEKEQNQNNNICTDCGNEIKAVKKPDGTIKSPQEVSEALGGLCVKCYNAKNKKQGETENE